MLIVIFNWQASRLWRFQNYTGTEDTATSMSAFSFVLICLADLHLWLRSLVNGLISADMAPSAPPRSIKQVFAQYSDGKKFMDASDLARFYQRIQGSENMTEESTALLISRFYQISQKDPSLNYDCLNIHEFFDFLATPELNSLMQTSEQPTHDMTAPLSNYLIYSSHNSYLTGNQLTSRSGTEMIEKALQDGCRVVELDCWERNGQIVVLHGHTVTEPVGFEDCLRAIKRNAFVRSEYPVIITLENHLSLDLQVEAARILKDILGDSLYLPSPEERPPRVFASPDALKCKIIISDSPPKAPLSQQVAAANTEASADNGERNRAYLRAQEDDDEDTAVVLESDMFDSSNASEEMQVDFSEDLQQLIYISSLKLGQITVESARGLPTPGEHCIMVNLSEPQVKKLMKEDAESLIRYTQRNLGRMYPFGLRFDSSNANPYQAWANGFQMAAINYQAHDRPCWITRALFEANGKCGYVSKPPILLQHLEPHSAEITPKLSLKIRVLMAFKDDDAHELGRDHDLYVKIAIDGHPLDKANEKTNTIHNGKELIWEDQLFHFSLRVPEIAILRLEVWDDDTFNRDDFVGQSCISIDEMKEGIRITSLQSREGEVLHPNVKLLCWVEKELWSNGARQ
ncbi:hypothetical protein KP509_37G043500 [Ceratopteris richardii]|uniref:Phosphoinositide phospholipase C n=1 Tax=Ceratopteris richardii TaxID=49495 RepID=A0A8T2Q786_CERRI|nr:hypothetical protein KP509_37G043500 [Ceratopteris richardii]